MALLETGIQLCCIQHLKVHHKYGSPLISVKETSEKIYCSCFELGSIASYHGKQSLFAVRGNLPEEDCQNVSCFFILKFSECHQFGFSLQFNSSTRALKWLPGYLFSCLRQEDFEFQSRLGLHSEFSTSLGLKD